MSLDDFHWSDMIVKVVSALVILVVTAFIARILKKVLTKQLGKVSVLQRHSGGGDSLAVSLGGIAALIVWLFGLMAVLNLFALTTVVTPLQDMLSSMLGAIPRVIGAGLVLYIGFMLAKIVRELLVTALQAANVDRFADKLSSSVSGQVASADQPFDTDQPLGDQGPTGASVTPTTQPVRISAMLGQIVFSLILLVVGIAALQVLDIKSISEPATQMLSMILNAIPVIIAAGILLAIGVVIAKMVAGLLEALLRGMNLDAAASKLGVDTTKTDLTAIITKVVQVAIVLFFAVAATNLLGFPQITQMLNTVLALGGRVVFGAVIIVAGVFIANLIAGFLSGSTANIVRIATIVLFAAIGLKYMGLADSIINLAFGALVVGGAAAAALAFGLGGRDAAARQLEKVQNNSTK